MTDIAAGRQLRLPEDLAQILIEEGIATPGGIEWRDSIPGIIESAAALTAAVITLAQIPVTLDHLRQIIKRWLAKRASGQQQGSYRAQNPNGSTDTFTDQTDPEVVLAIFCVLIFRPRPRPPADE